MSVQHASCPSCGSPVPFRPGTLVSTCQVCDSVVARTDRDVEAIGKVAALVHTGSPLDLGVRGTWQARDFVLVGRTQLKHAAGGYWDEWYLAFDDGTWGWLAEAQGKLYLTFDQQSTAPLPPRDRFKPGGSLSMGADVRWVVQESGTATLVTAKGELPIPFRPGSTREYVDLAGGERAFATIDYTTDPPSLFVGREVSLAELRIEAQEAPLPDLSIPAASLNCPHCGGTLKLQAPDQAQRVTCPFCDSMLDATQGNLRYLETLKSFDKGIIHIPLGREGTIQGDRYICIGFMQRSCVVYRTRYAWSEYLLFRRGHGFRWLMESDGHWTFLEPVSVADVQLEGRTADFQRRTFRKYQQVIAKVDHVRGEFYWRVEEGETARAADYVSPPEQLSVEYAVSGDSVGGQSEEVNWTHGVYVPGEEIWEAFGLEGRPPIPSGIAPNQPNPQEGMGPAFTGLAILFSVVCLVAAIASAVVGPGDFNVFYVMIAAAVIWYKPMTVSSSYGQFERERWENAMSADDEQ